MFDDYNRFIKGNMVPATGQTVANRTSGRQLAHRLLFTLRAAYSRLLQEQARSPRLSEMQRRELAVNLIRARGLVPAV